MIKSNNLMIRSWSRKRNWDFNDSNRFEHILNQKISMYLGLKHMDLNHFSFWIHWTIIRKRMHGNRGGTVGFGMSSSQRGFHQKRRWFSEFTWSDWSWSHRMCPAVSWCFQFFRGNNWFKKKTQKKVGHLWGHEPRTWVAWVDTRYHIR